MTTKKKIVFVVNPISGTQGKRAILKWIDERINRTLYDYTIVKTQYAGHAEKIAATAAKEKVDIVVAYIYNRIWYWRRWNYKRNRTCIDTYGYGIRHYTLRIGKRTGTAFTNSFGTQGCY